MKEMRIPDLIIKKRDGLCLDRDEIEAFVRGVVDGTVTGAQTGAMLMSMYLSGLDTGETVSLTEAMVRSGETLAWPAAWKGRVVDKHSTGGVGDKVSLPLAPALAACGLKVPMISGRGLGHTGGTLDKLESIPGLCVSWTAADITSMLDTVGACIVGQTSSLVPADKVLYATRDTTGTVDSAPLITASVMSKKVAETLDALVLEITFGRAANMKAEEEARTLAHALIRLGCGLNIKTSAMLTRMDQPIGKMVGNALEIVETVECLKGKGPDDLREVITKLGGQLLHDAGKVKSLEEGVDVLGSKLDDGSAKVKFIEMLVAQGVDSDVAHRLFDDDCDIFSILPKAKYTTDVSSDTSGYVWGINAMTCGVLANQLGAGRTRPGESVNHAVGLQLHAQRGDYVSAGSAWVTVHHDCPTLGEDKVAALQSALHVEVNPPPPQYIIGDVITLQDC